MFERREPPVDDDPGFGMICRKDRGIPPIVRACALPEDRELDFRQFLPVCRRMSDGDAANDRGGNCHQLLDGNIHNSPPTGGLVAGMATVCSK
jgi:hypothetical protein